MAKSANGCVVTSASAYTSDGRAGAGATGQSLSRTTCCWRPSGSARRNKRGIIDMCGRGSVGFNFQSHDHHWSRSHTHTCIPMHTLPSRARTEVSHCAGAWRMGAGMVCVSCIPPTTPRLDSQHCYVVGLAMAFKARQGTPCHDRHGTQDTRNTQRNTHERERYFCRR